jgi:hypothetical protein
LIDSEKESLKLIFGFSPATQSALLARHLGVHEIEAWSAIDLRRCHPENADSERENVCCKSIETHNMTEQTCSNTGLPDLSWYKSPKQEKNQPKWPQNTPNGHKIHQIATKYTKWPQNTPNGHKIHQMNTKYTKWP